MAAYLCALLYIYCYVPCPPLDKSFERYLVNFTVKLKLGDGYSRWIHTARSFQNQKGVMGNE